MDLIEHYNDLWEQSIGEIRADNFKVDTLIDSPSDDRHGLTLLLRPGDDVKKNILKFLDDLRNLEPDQYYYRPQDLHITVMSIISCYSGFRLEQISVPEYIGLIRESIARKKKFTVRFRGITASPSCIMVQGFMNNMTLGEIRDELRLRFKNSSLQQSIDQRYAIQTAHSTVIRFRKELKNKEHYLERLEKYRTYDFGAFEVSALELVFNDWYQRQENVKKLATFELH